MKVWKGLIASCLISLSGHYSSAASFLPPCSSVVPAGALTAVCITYPRNLLPICAARCLQNPRGTVSQAQFSALSGRQSSQVWPCESTLGATEHPWRWPVMGCYGHLPPPNSPHPTSTSLILATPPTFSFVELIKTVGWASLTTPSPCIHFSASAGPLVLSPNKIYSFPRLTNIPLAAPLPAPHNSATSIGPGSCSSLHLPASRWRQGCLRCGPALQDLTGQWGIGEHYWLTAQGKCCKTGMNPELWELKSKADGLLRA